MILKFSNRSSLFDTVRFATVLVSIFVTDGVAASTPTLFLPPVTYGSGGGEPLSVAIADINGDGKPDLVVANQCEAIGCSRFTGIVGVLLGNGDGTFQPAASYDSGGFWASSVVLADVNGDHKPDIVVANCGPAGTFSCQSEHAVVAILLGTGDGTFQPPMTYDSGGYGPSTLAVGDVNGDGRPDVVVGNNSGDGVTGEGNVAVLVSNGDGTFQAAVTYDSGGLSANSVALGDVNSDSKLDLLVSNLCNPDNCAIGILAVLLGNGDGTFHRAVAYDSGGYQSTSIAVNDVNGDGNADLVAFNEDNAIGDCTSGIVGVLLGFGDGTFQPAVSYNSGGNCGNSGAVALADVNRDGIPDVLDVNSNINGFGRIGVLLGNGDGTFLTPVNYDSGGSTPGALAVADLNGDTLPDVVVTECDVTGCANGNLVGVLLNGTDTTAPVITVSATPQVLWPPNGKMVSITVSGTITDTGSGVNATTAAYAVKDEYGEVQPHGVITLGVGGTYTFTVWLQASRLGTDTDGRLYAITVRAKDNAGNIGLKTGVVNVPHAQGHLAQ